MHKIGFFHVAAIVMCVFIAGCGTGAQEASKVDFFRIGGTIVGLEGAGLEIRNNNTDTLVFEKPDGRDNRDVKIPFTFPVAISNGGSYFVSVSMQPVQRRQFCAVKNGDGQVFNRDFENVEVMCSVNKFSINGKVLGLQGGGLVIQNNWTDDLGVKGAQEISLSPDNKVSGAQVDFIFPEVEGLDSFEVVVRKQPNLLRPQHCSVRHDEINPGAGKIANQSVTNVIIDCSADLYTLKGSAAFLDQSNTTLQIKSVYSTENKTEIVTVDKAGAFEFTTNLAQGSSFDVSIGTQPIGTNILLSQTCWVDGNTGHGNINATTPAVIIKCGYRVGGSVKGLMLGAHITLLNKSNGEVLPIDMDGKFTLLQPVLAGLDYEVQVEQQPTNGQRCHVTNGGGTHTMGSANVRDVTIVCGQTIGGSILGLAAGASMVLQNNSADDLTVNANGTFEFFTALPKGSGFRVSILTPPGNQPCVITYGNGIVKTYNIRSINVLCGTAPTPSGSVQAIASMGTAREGHAAIFSPGDIFGGSSILVAGGRDINGIALNSVERYDIAKNVWSSYGTMTNARSSHTMTQLWGGSIVAVGGFASSAGVKQHLASAEVYSGTYWITGGSMKMSRSGHTATALPDGTLLVVGGYNSNTKALASSELLTLGTASAWVDVGSLNVARTGHTATFLSSGKILVVGGQGADGNYLSSSELYDPATKSWTLLTPSRGSILARANHTATWLTDGRVLVVGGDDGVNYFGDANIYDATTNIWTAAATQSVKRSQHTAVLLKNGKVLVAGGVYAQGWYHSSASIYDPKLNRWLPAIDMISSRGNYSVVSLSNGMIAFLGGINRGGAIALAEQFDIGNDTWTRSDPKPIGAENSVVLLKTGKVLVTMTDSKSSFIYDVEKNSWGNAGDRRFIDHGMSVTLHDGRVLVTGGTTPPEMYDYNSNKWFALSDSPNIHSANYVVRLLNGKVLSIGDVVEIYDPELDRWNSVSAPSELHLGGAVSLLPDGKVALIGGFKVVNSVWTGVGVEVYDSDIDVWSPAPDMSTSRAYHSATVLPNDTVLVVGGFDGKNSLLTSEIYNPKSNSWTPGASLSTNNWTIPASSHSANLLPDGTVLCVGGYWGPLGVKYALKYDPIADSWSMASDMMDGRVNHRTVTLFDGRLMVIGGIRYANKNPPTEKLDSAEIYH